MTTPIEHSPMIPSYCTPDEHGHCITCSDEALEVRVISFDEQTLQATVAIGDATIEVDAMLIDELAPGDTILIHGGVAIGKV